MSATTRAVVHRPLTVWLASAAILAIAMGPAFTLRQGERQAPILWLEIVSAALVGALVLRALTIRREPPFLPALIGVVSCLAVGLVTSPDAGLALVTFSRLTIGLAGGWAVALAWRRSGEAWNIIDASLAVTGFLIAVQLLLSLRSDPEVAYVINRGELSWGRSNYVAAVLAISSVALIGRLRVCRPHLVWWVAPIVMIYAAYRTLSRASLVGIAAGLVLLALLRARRTSKSRAGRGLVVVVIVLIGLYAFTQISRSRADVQTEQHLAATVESRLDQWRLARDSFLESPLVGTGYGELRLLTAERSTYAHNVVLSMLQQVGLLAVPFLVLLTGLGVKAFRRGRPELRPALVVILVISQVQPLFEGTGGALVSWSVIWFSYLSPEWSTRFGRYRRSNPDATTPFTT